MMEGALARREIILLACPCLERWGLQGAAIGEAQYPWMRAHLIHGIEMRGCQLVALTTGQECDTWYRTRHVTFERAHRRSGDSLHISLHRALLAGNHHVWLEYHALK